MNAFGTGYGTLGLAVTALASRLNLALLKRIGAARAARGLSRRSEAASAESGASYSRYRHPETPGMHRFIALLAALFATSALAAETPIPWREWSHDVFEEAKRERKFVLLDLEAVWCHWCHVMDDITYRDPEVARLIESSFIPVKVDQDAHPDLSNRYELYGWPATVVFAADGTEIVKRQGYIPPKPMSSMLAAIVADPSPGPSVVAAAVVEATSSGLLSDALRDRLIAKYRGAYDHENAGWGIVHKFIQPQNMEYAIVMAQAGDRDSERMARATLDAALNLIDPAWGGMYQYSDEVDWKSPHFEKIMSSQADPMKLYSLAYLAWGEPRYLAAARDIERFLTDFLTSSDGAFYTSQNADLSATVDGKAFFRLPDAERRQLGLPRVDRNVYARENGWAIRGLLALYDATGDAELLARATRAARWIVTHRAVEGGGFAHGEADRAGPFLGDTLATAQAFLSLYASTGEREWLERAQSAARFVGSTFRDDIGFRTAARSRGGVGVFGKAVLQIDENLELARFANLLAHYTGEAGYRAMSEHALRYLFSPAVAGSHRFLATMLLAEREFAADPAHITIVGGKQDALAAALHGRALRYPSTYRRIEWWDRKEGAMPNPDVTYPELERAAAFVCVNHACSLPIFEPEKVVSTAERLMAAR